MQDIALHDAQRVKRRQPNAAATYIQAKKECQKHAQSYKYSRLSLHRLKNDAKVLLFFELCKFPTSKNKEKYIKVANLFAYVQNL